MEACNNLSAGLRAERAAQSYLIKRGLQLISTNYRCRYGEIDLVMRDDAEIVFIEVRSRGSIAFGGALESITRSKQHKIINTALYYMQIKNISDVMPMRFDVIAIYTGASPSQLEWIKNAF